MNMLHNIGSISPAPSKPLNGDSKLTYYPYDHHVKLNLEEKEKEIEREREREREKRGSERWTEGEGVCDTGKTPMILDENLGTYVKQFEILWKRQR